MIFGTPLFWRETMKPGKFLIFEGRVVFVLLPTIMHLRLWTLTLSVVTMFVFWYFDRKGVSANSIMRFLRSKLIGKKRSARGTFEERLPVDFFFEPQQMAREAQKGRGKSLTGTGAQTKSMNPLVWLGMGPKPQNASVVLEKEGE